MKFKAEFEYELDEDNLPNELYNLVIRQLNSIAMSDDGKLNIYSEYYDIDDAVNEIAINLPMAILSNPDFTSDNPEKMERDAAMFDECAKIIRARIQGQKQ